MNGGIEHIVLYKSSSQQERIAERGKRYQGNLAPDVEDALDLGLTSQAIVEVRFENCNALIKLFISLQKTKS